MLGCDKTITTISLFLRIIVCCWIINTVAGFTRWIWLWIMNHLCMKRTRYHTSSTLKQPLGNLWWLLKIQQHTSQTITCSTFLPVIRILIMCQWIKVSTLILSYTLIRSYCQISTVVKRKLFVHSVQTLVK